MIFLVFLYLEQGEQSTSTHAHGLYRALDRPNNAFEYIKHTYHFFRDANHLHQHGPIYTLKTQVFFVFLVEVGGVHKKLVDMSNMLKPTQLVA